MEGKSSAVRRYRDKIKGVKFNERNQKISPLRKGLCEFSIVGKQNDSIPNIYSKQSNARDEIVNMIKHKYLKKKQNARQNVIYNQVNKSAVIDPYIPDSYIRHIIYRNNSLIKSVNYGLKVSYKASKANERLS